MRGVVRIAGIASIAALVACAGACSDPQSAYFESGGEMPREKSAFAAPAAVLSEEAVAGFALSEGAAELAADSSPEAPLIQPRMLARTASVELEVASIKEARAALDAAIARHGAWIKSESSGASESYLTVAVPSEKLDAFLNGLDAIGTLLRKGLEAIDYTDAYTDMEERAKTRKVLLDTYRSYLRKAADVGEILKIERAINDLTFEIERIEGGMRQIERKVEYSDVTITMVLPPLARVDEGRELSFGERIEQAFRDLGSALAEFGIGFIIVLIFAIPFGLAGWLLWFVLFGSRIGVIRALWKRHRARKPAPIEGEKR